MTNNVNNIVAADVFVVPNPIDRLGDLYFNTSLKSKLEKLGITTNDDTKLVQVWVTGGGSDNWGDHGDPITGDYFANRLPLDLVRDLKEGESIVLPFNGNMIKLTARQLNYRYKRFGKFEEVLEKLAA